MQEQSHENGSSPKQPVDASTSNGILRFLNSYQNPLSRLSVPTGVQRSAGPILRTLSGSSISSVQTKETSSPADSQPHVTLTPPPVLAAPNTSAVCESARGYRLTTVIMVALIAFLIGSLLRSMLSPADFVYVVADLSEVSGDMSSGWREIKRLVEVKYIVGGWDFQVALVRRH
jgi:hypothetical protein